MGWFGRLGWTVNTDWALHSLEELRNFGVWNLVALGAGGIILLESIVRLALPEYWHDVGGKFIFAAILIAVGLDGWLNWSMLWPIILIAIGVNGLLKGLGRKRS